MKTLSVLALGAIVGLCLLPRVDAAAQFNQGRDRARGDQVCVYKDINYQGPEQCYGAGEINNLGALRQSISSIRVYGRATVTVYENTDFRGRSAQFMSDVSDLGRQMMAGNTAWSDHIDSLRITESSGALNAGGSGNTGTYSRNSPGTPRDGICVYELPSYQGHSQCWSQGQSISNLARQDNWSSQISSIRLFGRAIAVVYRDVNFRGENMTVDRDIPDLASVAARNNGNARGQENSNGRGRGNGRNANWDHQISSIHIQEQR
jgi:hypothetical protein